MFFWIIAILIFLVILAAVIAFSNLTVNIEFHRRPDLQKVKTKIFLFKKIKIYGQDIKLNQPKIETDEEHKQHVKRQIEEGIDILFSSVDIINDYNDQMKKINKKIIKGLKGNKMELRLIVGTEDAALTGLLCGAIWAILGNLRMQKESGDLFTKMNFIVCPSFNKNIFAIDINCIFTIKTVYIMYVYETIEKLFKI
jgi:hypothetical protein